MVRSFFTPGFVNDVIFCHNRPGKGGRVRHLLKVTHQGQHGFDTVAYNQTDSLDGTTGPAVETDVCNYCLVVIIILNYANRQQRSNVHAYIQTLDNAHNSQARSNSTVRFP